jgi:magnesium-protoporphyrin O-methyltransferase
MAATTYAQRRGQLETYFDRTAVAAWARLTSDAPVSYIRGTVRAGRDAMRQTLLSWLPQDLKGARVLDAGCGTGALAVAAAARGARVTAVDLSANLVALARQRLPADAGAGSIEFVVGDMLDPRLGSFDYIVGMDSLIHYRAGDVVDSVARLAAGASRAIMFTFAPRTPLLATMHAAGRLFPRGNRAPAIEPLAERTIARSLAADMRLAAWRQARTQRIATGFYTSQALELVRS